MSADLALVGGQGEVGRGGRVKADLVVEEQLGRRNIPSGTWTQGQILVKPGLTRSSRGLLRCHTPQGIIVVCWRLFVITSAVRIGGARLFRCLSLFVPNRSSKQFHMTPCFHGS